VKISSPRSQTYRTLCLMDCRAEVSRRPNASEFGTDVGETTCRLLTVSSLACLALAIEAERRMAERKGFEPLEAFRLQRFSRPPP
jgi:hypothetical protein